MPHHDFVHRLAIHARASERLTDGHRSELGGMHGLKRSPVAPDGRPRRPHDHDARQVHDRE